MIARELSVDAVLEGSVQQSDGRVKIRLQLLHAPTDTHLWARDYERELTDVLKLQNEVAREGRGADPCPNHVRGACADGFGRGGQPGRS